MSKQLAISACFSILAMAGLAVAAPSIADHSSAHAPVISGAETGATMLIAAPDFTN